MPLRTTKRLLLWSAAGAFLCGSALAPPANAMPMFAQKYSLSCAYCHTMVPRLNTFGYEFRRAGFRLPGAPNNTSHAFKDVASIVLSTRLATASPSGDTGLNLKSDLKVAGAMDDHISGRVTYTFASKDDGGPTGFERAWVRYNSAPMGTFWDATLGQMPVTDGYNLEGNRNWMLTDTPLVMGANGPLAGSSTFPRGNFDLAGLERGLEGGFDTTHFSARVSWLNGITESGIGSVGASSSGPRFHDVEAQFDYLPGNSGSAISGVFYHGVTPLHDLAAPGNPRYDNDFFRAGLFGTYQRQLRAGTPGIPDLLFELNAGYIVGKDKVALGGPYIYSDGAIVEADLYHQNRSSLGVRYDQARRSETAGAPITKAFTVDLATRPSDLVQIGLEYRTQASPGAHSLIAGLTLYY